MAIVVGSENVSREQLEYLRRADDLRGSPKELATLLLHVTTDTDLVDRDETLHPDWISLFNDQRDHLEATLAGVDRPSFEHLRELFDSLTPLASSIANINPQEEEIVFLLGAGASKPCPSSIPTVTELLPALLRRARRLDREQVTSLVDFCQEQRIDNIEDLLTAVQISDFCSRNPKILSLVQFQLFGHNNRSRRHTRRVAVPTDVSSVAYLQDTFHVLFGLLSNLMLPAKPNSGHQAIAQYLGERPSTPIITTNYDCCIDRALISNNIPFSYPVDFANDLKDSSALTKPSSLSASLIKLHGSLNWFYCETCQKVRLIDIEKTVNDYNLERGEYPIISVCNECGGQKRGLLVPPHAMKFDIAPPLQPLIATAASHFERSTLIVVVGFSFAEADLYISRMLIKAMQESNKIRLIIIDPDPQIVEKMRLKFNAQIDGFDSQERIIGLQGDCSEILPQFLSGKLFKAPPKDVV